MRISGVAFRQFAPFADAELEFPPCTSTGPLGEVHLLTGQNGTGKTRLLCLLAAACGNKAPLAARFAPTTESGVAVFCQRGSESGVWSSCWGLGEAIWFKGDGKQAARESFRTGRQDSRVIGRSTTIMDRTAREAAAAAAFAFRGIARVAEVKVAPMATLELGTPADHLTFEPSKNEDLLICQSMVNLKLLAAMDADRLSARDESRPFRLLRRLQQSISEITGREFAFDVVPHPEVRLRVFWGGVAMRLQQLPDGLRSIIGWLVSCVAKLDALLPEHPDLLNVPLIMLLDEPEGHLHPAWQRKVLPAAQTLFPHAQIFAATHSPFVISSVNEGWIHVFRPNDAGVVTVDKPRPCGKGDTYLDVVEDILGVKEWYDPETERLLDEFRETRDGVLAGKDEYRKLADQAKAIAGRSDSLRDLMGREMRQVERLKGQAASRP